MKNFFLRHGEKVFLVFVVIIGGWSLTVSVRKLRMTSALSDKDRTAIEAIDRFLKDHVASVRKVAPYRKRLLAAFDGHGVYEPREPVPAPIFFEPKDTALPERRKRFVDAELGLPREFSASASRGRIAVSFTEAVAVNASVVRYEVYRLEGEGEWPEQPGEPIAQIDGAAGEGRAGKRSYTFVDTGVKPEMRYSYRARTIGREAPSEGKTVRVPDNVDVRAGLWFTRLFSRVASATTPSDMEFECIAIYEDYPGYRVTLRIKRWNNEKNGWDVFRTARGVAAGERIIGQRTHSMPPVTETFDTGYILKKIGPEFRIEIFWKDEYVEDPPGSGQVTKKKVKKERKIPIHVLLFEKADGSLKLKMVVEGGRSRVTVVGEKKPALAPKKAAAAPGKPAAPKKPPRAKKPSTGGGLLERMKKKLESKKSVAPATPAREAGAAEAGKKPAEPEAKRGPAGPKRVGGAGTTATVLLSGLWTETPDLEQSILESSVIDPQTMRELTKGAVAAFRSGPPDAVGILVDRAMGEKDIALLAGGGTAGLSDEEVLKLVCEGIRRMGMKSLPEAEAMGGARIQRSKADRAIADSLTRVGGPAGKRLILRYCALAPGHLYELTFVCEEKQYGFLNRSFQAVVKTWDW